MSLDDEIRRFLEFWKRHGGEDLSVRDGVIYTAGCDGGEGCCSKHHDLGGLADALEELIGDNDEP